MTEQFTVTFGARDSKTGMIDVLVDEVRIGYLTTSRENYSRFDAKLTFGNNHFQRWDLTLDEMQRHVKEFIKWDPTARMKRIASFWPNVSTTEGMVTA